MIATFKKLLVINIVASNRFGDSSKRIIKLSFFVVLVLISLSWAGLSEKKAISVPEIIAEKNNNRKINKKFITVPKVKDLIIESRR